MQITCPNCKKPQRQCECPGPGPLGVSEEVLALRREIERIKAVKGCYYECVSKQEADKRIAELQAQCQTCIQFSDLDELIAQLECDATRVRKAADYEMYKGRRRGLLGHHAGMQEAIRTVKAFRDSYLTIDREQE